MSHSEVTFLKGKTKQTIPPAKLEQAALLAKAYLDAQSPQDGTHQSMASLASRLDNPEVQAASEAFTDFLEGLPAEHLRDIEVLYYQQNPYTSFAEGWDELADRFKTVTHDELVRDVSGHAGLIAQLPARLGQQLFTVDDYPTSLTLPKLSKLVTSCKAYLGAEDHDERMTAIASLAPLVNGLDQVALREVETLCAYLRPENPDDAYDSYEQAWNALALESPNPTRNDQIDNVARLYDTISSLF